MTVRAATIEDLDWIIEQVKRFAGFYGTRKSLVMDESYARNGLRSVIENHLVIIAEKDGVRAGFIAGLFTPHMFNPSIRLLCELFWWVAEPFRNTRAAYMLLKEYVRQGKEKSDWVTMCSIVNSPVNEKALERHGFKLMERSFLMEV